MGASTSTAKGKRAAPAEPVGQVERVVLPHGFVALMYEQLQPGPPDPPEAPAVKTPVYKPGYRT